ncbi:MAG: phytanoyl-CoA dioxygenase family protein [Deltaproteobacteria bacterium]|nr:phytanoyl-CoA dioxygenase family protein [Deltaproteobacteria bacterium]
MSSAIETERAHGDGAAREVERALAEVRERGVAVIEGVLSQSEARAARAALLEAAAESERRGVATFMPALDPNAANVRVFNLLDMHEIFRELILHPLAAALVRGVLGEHFAISNFTANIARPGSGSMSLHSDQSLVVPEPWLAPWSMNVVWCLDDVYAENGGTLYLPGSQRFTRRAEVPANPLAQMKAFTAPCGSIVAMDGRVWHTSGANVTKNTERALLFAYYSVDFLRPQVNHNVTLSAETQARLSPELFARLKLGADSNLRIGGEIIGERPRPLGGAR